jgi:hypothetical protein
MKKIEITFMQDGSCTIEAKGFNGSGCLDATAPFEEALGIVTDRKKKPEYHVVTTAKKQNVIKR